MKTISSLLPILLSPLALAAQEVPPERLAELERERSRACVPALARLAAVSADLEPLARRSERIRALAAAVSMEDTSAVAPFDPADPVESAVRDWFAADQELALEYVETGDEAIQERRSEARQRILERLAEAMREVGARGRERLGAEDDIEGAAMRCEDAILVRSAVIEACDAGSGPSPACDAARTSDATGAFRFVERAEDLWDVESLRPWTSPSRLRPGPDGGLTGARTVAMSRRGNLELSVGVEPLIQPRASVSEEEQAAMGALLDSLGFAFEHPDAVMAPALVIRFDAPGVLGGETDYLLHFGDLSNPAEQVVWRAPATGEGPIQALVPATGRTLERLAAGEPLSLTAARLPEEEGGEGDAIYTLGLPSAGQAGAVGGLVQYMAGGQLARDLTALLEPSAPSPPRP